MGAPDPLRVRLRHRLVSPPNPNGAEVSRSMSKFWEYRLSVAAALSLRAGAMLLDRVPFPADHALLLLVYSQKPWLYYAIRAAYLGMAFTTPFFLCSMCMSVGYIFFQSNEPGESAEPLPPYPE